MSAGISERLEVVLRNLRQRVRNTTADNFQIFILLVALLAMFKIYRTAVRRTLYPLPEAVYANGLFSSVILAEPLAITVFIGPVIVLMPIFDRLKWQNLSHGYALRIVALVTATVMVWATLPLEYNYYFDQHYPMARVALICLLVLSYFHPICIPPLTALIFSFQGQLMYPFGLSNTSERVPLQMLVLFSSFLLLQFRYVDSLRTITEAARVDPRKLSTPESHIFIYAAAALLGASYAEAAMAKVELYWPWREVVAYHVPWAYTRGWLRFLDVEHIEQLFEILAAANPVLIWGTLIIEAGAIAIFWQKKWFAAILGGIFAFQLSTFVLTGIFFKKWLVVIAAFGVTVYVTSKESGNLFNRRAATLVTGIILMALVFGSVLPLTSLGWYSTTYDATYTMEAGGEDLDVKRISWGQMKPYDRHFRQNRFAFIDPNKTLVNYGARDTQSYAVLQRMRTATEPLDIKRLRSNHGRVQYDPAAAEEFDRIVRGYVQSQSCGRSTSWSSIPKLPHIFWGQPGTEMSGNKKIEWVRVRRTGYLYTDGDIRTVDSKIVRNISVDSAMCGS